MQYFLFCSSSDLLYNEVRREQRFEYIPSTSKLSYTFDT